MPEPDDSPVHVLETHDPAFALTVGRTGTVQFFATIPKMDVVLCLRRIADAMESGQGDMTIAGGGR